jgi:DNA-binding NarL/FixJ family response regulator
VATIRVLLADDSETVLEEVRGELANQFEIIGAVANGRDAIDASLRLHPDVLVLDIAMPVLNGIQAASALRGSHLRTKILFLSIHEQPEYIAAAFSAGASGYVSKRRLVIDLAVAIREVIHGRVFVSPTLPW